LTAFFTTKNIVTTAAKIKIIRITIVIIDDQPLLSLLFIDKIKIKNFKKVIIRR
jgi:hypothetical protein